MMKFVKTSIKNKRATFEYNLVGKYTAGIVLTGTEAKSVRLGKVNMSDGFCYIRNGEMWLKNVHIAYYQQGSYNNVEAKRERKLLLQRAEIRKIEAKLKEKGLTIVPIEMYINERGFVKLEISLAKGKKMHDKRHSLKDKQQKREIDRAKREY